MSFLKITEPKKRDLIVAEFLKTKKNIQRNKLAERLGEQDAMAQFTRQYKPITDVHKVHKIMDSKGSTYMVVLEYLTVLRSYLLVELQNN